MSAPDIERPDIVEQARAALRVGVDLVHALEAAWLMGDLVFEAERLRGERDRARDFAARLEADGARLVERVEGMIAERLAEVDLRPTPYAAGVRNCARSVLDILAEHRPGTMGGEG